MIKNEEKILGLAQKEYDYLANIFWQLSRNNTAKLGKYKYVSLQDILDLTKFYGFILDETYKKAQSWGRDLDTEVRSLIPTHICINLVEAERL